MATDDMLDLDVEPMDDAETLSDLTVAREMPLEGSGVESKSDAAAPETEQDAQTEDEAADEEKRGRRRRRRGRGRRGRGDEGRTRTLNGDEVEGEMDEGGEPDDEQDDPGLEGDDQENGHSRNKSLHKDVTPWVEAVGIIVTRIWKRVLEIPVTGIEDVGKGGAGSDRAMISGDCFS